MSLVPEYDSSDGEFGSELDSNSVSTNNDSNFTDILDESIEMSEMVLKNNIINACAHGPLSKSSKAMSSSLLESSRRIITEDGESGVIETEYRDLDTDDSVSSDSSSDVESVKDIEEVSSSEEEETATKEGKKLPPKVKGELDLDDLPPIEDLAISVPEDQCTLVGKVYNIVDKLVNVQALPELPAINLDSILFLEKGARPLGKVFDVFGPVTEPFYVVRFNSLDHIKQHGVEKGMEVFIAPKTDHTNYVFLSELMKIKGSDASWMNDIEPPPSMIEYSDDEQERRAKQEKKEKKRETTNNENPQEIGETSNVRRKAKPRRQDNRKFNRQNDNDNRQQPNKEQTNFHRQQNNFGGPSSNHTYRNPFARGNMMPPQRFAVPPFNPQYGAPLRLRPPNFITPNRMFMSRIPMGMPPPHFVPLAPGYQFVPGAPFARPNMPIFGTRFSRPPPTHTNWYSNTQPPPPPGT